jgi:hypothetical protein
MWMNAVSPLCDALTCSAMSTTGPQTRTWQSAGVEKMSMIGRLPRTSAKLSSCIVPGGTRVSIDFTSPPADCTVGVSIFGGLSPTSGTGEPLATSARAGSVATRRPSSFTTPITSYCPSSGSLTWAT